MISLYQMSLKVWKRRKDEEEERVARLELESERR